MTTQTTKEDEQMTLGIAPSAPHDDIKWRIEGKVDGGGGVRVVPYLDATTVSRLLDEWAGPLGWYDRYAPAEGEKVGLWCFLSVRDDQGEWVTKVDKGMASAFQPEKGLVSDAFKRTAMRKWGIGRNVFRLPTLRLPSGQFKTYQDKNSTTQGVLTEGSMGWIAGELKRLGFEDEASAAEAAHPTATDEDEPAPEPDAAPAAEPETQQPETQTTTEAQEQPEAAQLTPAQHTVSNLATSLDDANKAALRDWWRSQGIPGHFGQLTDEQCTLVIEKINALTEVPF